MLTARCNAQKDTTTRTTICRLTHPVWSRRWSIWTGGCCDAMTKIASLHTSACACLMSQLAVLVVRRSGVQWDVQGGGEWGQLVRQEEARALLIRNHPGPCCLCGLIYFVISTFIPSIKADPNVTAALLPACARLCPDCLANIETSLRSQVACATRTPHSQHSHATRV